MPTSDVSRWHRFGTGAADVPEPVVIRCARCGFATEGELEQARAAFQAHACETSPLPESSEAIDSHGKGSFF